MSIETFKRWHWACIGLALGLAFSLWRGWVGHEGELIDRPTLEPREFEKVLLTKTPSGKAVIKEIRVYRMPGGGHWLSAHQWVGRPGAERYVAVKIPAKTPFVVPSMTDAKVDPKFTVVDYLTAVKAKHPDLSFSMRWWDQEPLRSPIFAMVGMVVLAGVCPSLAHVRVGPSTGRRSNLSQRSSKPAQKRSTLRKEEANIRARGFLKENPTATARQLAAAIGCSLGMVPRLSAWQAVQEQRARGRQPKKARVVSLTTQMERVAGVADDPLAKLIAEQQADTEPSPLEPDQPARDEGAPRKVRLYGRA